MSLDLSHTLIHPSKLAAPNRWDFIAFPLILVLFVLLATVAKGTFAPLEAMQAAPISLDPTALPGYALRTVLRMLAALAASALFTLTYGTLAAKSKRAEVILIPILDILQSVPIADQTAAADYPRIVLGIAVMSLYVIFFTRVLWRRLYAYGERRLRLD